MSITIKPIIVVSKCLEFSPCRYNGQTMPCALVEKLKPFVQFITVCPEVEIGLGIPRTPVRLISINKKIQVYETTTDKYYTEKLENFCKNFILSLPDVDAFILKGRSPSCGIKDVKIFNSKAKSSSSQKGPGVFGKMILDTYTSLAIEEEGRLRNYRIREHFLVKLFTLFNFRCQVKASPSLSKLVKFQSDNKYLLMAYNQKEQKILGKIAANHDKSPLDKVIEHYEEHLSLLLSKPPRITTYINTLTHIYGYFSEYLSPSEKDFIIDAIQNVGTGRVLLSVPLHLLKAYAIKYNNEYLLSQTIWHPYPEELISFDDSGKVEEQLSDIAKKDCKP